MANRRLHALVWPTGPKLAAAIRAALDGGPAIAPLSPDTPPELLRHQLSVLRPADVSYPDGTVSALRNPVSLPADAALVVATSGSTGLAKGVVLTSAALRDSAGASLNYLNAGHGSWLCCLPLHYIAGVAVVARAHIAGARLTLMPSFSAAALPPTDFASLVPTMLHAAVGAGSLARLGHVLVGGGPIDADLRARAATDTTVTATYGMTETAGGCVYDGRPLPGYQVQVVQNRIALRGPGLASGYLGAPDTPFRDGWFHTNDLGAFAPDGTLQVLGRADDAINTGGVKVMAGPIRAVLLTHPGVTDAVVFGRPDPYWGQRVVAAVTANTAVSLSQLRNRVTPVLGPAAAPRELLHLASLPLLPNGKPDLRSIADLPAGEVY